jgi:hypothetical protein
MDARDNVAPVGLQAVVCRDEPVERNGEFRHPVDVAHKCASSYAARKLI